MLDVTFLGAGLAGLLSFFTPCVLPMVPFYLCYMAGLSMSELRGDQELTQRAQRRLVFSSVLFAFGVTTIFVLMGMGATALGQAFAQWRDTLKYVAVVVMLAFGLHFLGLVRIPILFRDARLESTSNPATVWGAYVMGLAFGFGWTPCVGPALASILMIASGMGDVARGGLLLFVYGLGMTGPFILAAVFARPFLGWVQRNRHLMVHMEKIMGAMLIVFAVLIATDSVNMIAQWMIDAFPAFRSVG